MNYIIPLFCSALLLFVSCAKTITEPEAIQLTDTTQTTDSIKTTSLLDFDHPLLESFQLLSFADADNQGKSTIVFDTILESSSKSGRLSFSLDQGANEYDPFAGVILKFPSAGYDCSAYKGLSVRYRGDAFSLLLITSTVLDYADYKVELPASPVWKTITVSFEQDFFQPSWGKAVPLALDKITGISFQKNAKHGTKGSFEFDDLKLMKTVTKEIQNDMQVKDPEIPELLPIKSGTVTSPVQAKVEKYLTKGVNLSDWMETVEPFNGTFKYDRKWIKNQADQRFKSIRFPIDLDKFVKNKSAVITGTATFELEPSLFLLIDSLLLWTETYGLSLTIDYHQYDNSLNAVSVNNAGYRVMASNCWKEVANYVASNKRDDIFLELTNEPGISDDVPNDAWRVLAKEMLDSIRTVNKRHTVIYGDSRWYNIETLISSPLFAPDDGNIVYAFHYYGPFIFTHQAAEWAEGLGNSKNVEFPYTKESWSTEFSNFGISTSAPSWILSSFKEYYKTGNKNAMMNEVIPVKNWAIQNNVAIVCNEFGAFDRKSSLDSRKNWFKAATSIFDELGIGWAYWFGASDETGTLHPGMAEAMGLK